MGNALFVKTQQLLPELLFLTLQVCEVRSVSVLAIFIGQNGDALGFSSHNLNKIVHEQHELLASDERHDLREDLPLPIWSSVRSLHSSPSII